LSLTVVGGQVFSNPLDASPGKKVKVWQLEQRNQLGTSTTYLGDNGVVVINPQQNVKWVCTAPTWKVTIVNYKLNIGRTVDIGSYALRRNSTFEYGNVAGVTRLPMVYLGKRAHRISYQVTASDPIKEKVEMFYQTASKRSGSFSGVELTISDSIKAKPQVLDFLGGLYKLAKLDGVLLQQSHIYPGGKRNSVVSTDLIKQVEVDDSVFAYPTKFKFAYMHEIMQEDQKALQMSGVMEDLFLDTPPKKKK